MKASGKMYGRQSEADENDRLIAELRFQQLFNLSINREKLSVTTIFFEISLLMVANKTPKMAEND